MRCLFVCPRNYVKLIKPNGGWALPIAVSDWATPARWIEPAMHAPLVGTWVSVLACIFAGNGNADYKGLAN